jgi:hypothetical protein
MPGETWFVSFNPPSNPEGATAAMSSRPSCSGLATTRSDVHERSPGSLVIDPSATARRPSGKPTAIRRRSARGPRARRLVTDPTGCRRPSAARQDPWQFEYHGARPDDQTIWCRTPARELRALRVFGAWTNLTDMKSGSTLGSDHDQRARGGSPLPQDVGSTFGMGANGPHDWDEGWGLHEGGATRQECLFGMRSPGNLPTRRASAASKATRSTP